MCLTRDLAARNVLIGANVLEVKISDYGLSRDLNEADYYRLRSGGALPLRFVSVCGQNHLS